MVFEPAWISSVEHLGAFHKIVGKASLLRRLFGRYEIPEGFPHVQMSLAMRCPIVMFSAGRLAVAPDRIEFEATAPRGFSGRQYRALHLDLRFALTDDDVLSIEAYQDDAPIRYYTMPFLRVKTIRSGELSDFLVCVGGSGPAMGNSRTQNALLLDELRRAFPERMQVQAPAPLT